MIKSIIVAVANENVIGAKNTLPWHLPADMLHFKTLTTNHPVIMGQKTHESIGKVLPNRTNIVVSDNPNYQSKGCVVVHTLDDAFKAAEKTSSNECFIIGGASIYQQTLDMVDRIYLTQIHHQFEGDVFFPKIDKQKWQLISCQEHKADNQNPYPFDFCLYQRLSPSFLKS